MQTGSDNDQDSTFISHDACPDCGSSDALGVYDDAHTYCFSCHKHTQNAEPSEAVMQQQQPLYRTKDKAIGKDLFQGEVQALPARGLTEETCRCEFGYVCTTHNGENVQAAMYGTKTDAQWRRSYATKTQEVQHYWRCKGYDTIWFTFVVEGQEAGHLRRRD